MRETPGRSDEPLLGIVDGELVEAANGDRVRPNLFTEPAQVGLDVGEVELCVGLAAFAAQRLDGREAKVVPIDDGLNEVTRSLHDSLRSLAGL